MRRLRGWIRGHGRWFVLVSAFLVATPALPHCVAPASSPSAAASDVPSVAGSAPTVPRAAGTAARASAPSDDCAVLELHPRATSETVSHARRAHGRDRVSADPTAGVLPTAVSATGGSDQPRAADAREDGSDTWLRTRRLRI